MADNDHPERPSPTAGPVLLVNLSSRRGGAERSLELLIQCLHTSGQRIAVVSPKAGIFGRVLENASGQHYQVCAFEPVRHPDPIQAIRLALQWLWCSLRVAWAIVVFRAAIVHANSTNAVLAALLPARMLGRPLVWHVRDLTRLGRLGRLCGRSAQAVIAVSQAVRTMLLKEGVPADKVHTIYNGVEATFADATGRDRIRNEWRARLSLPPHAFVYLNVGQFVEWKRQDLFVRTAAQVLRRFPNSRFLIVGGNSSLEGPRVQARLAQLARQLGLTDRLVLLDWQDDIVPLLFTADALVHTAESEPFGRILVEAMKADLPVMAIRSAGPAEIIEDGQSGLLAEAGNPDSLVAIMMRMQEDPGLRERLIEAGRRRAADGFSAETTAKQIQAVYHEIAITRGRE